MVELIRDTGSGHQSFSEATSKRKQMPIEVPHGQKTTDTEISCEWLDLSQSIHTNNN